VSSLFYKTLEYGWDDLCTGNIALFFEGFEFNQPFSVEKTDKLERLVPSQSLISQKGFERRFISRIINKLGL
jgi:hypothetical protein